MPHKPARVLEGSDLTRFLKSIERSRYPLRNRTIILLSFHAGLRACEIAGLDWAMILAPSGRLAEQITLSSMITKGKKSRNLPLSPLLQQTLKQLHREQGRPQYGPVIRSERGSHMTARSVVNWFRSAYDNIGLQGCSSHSGRRTFITRAARLLPRINGSLRDVQELAGHSSLSTTERYIAGDRAIQRKLVHLI